MANIEYKPKSAIIIDGADTHACARALGTEIDYRKLKQWAQARSIHLRSFYFTAVTKDSEGHSTLRPLLDWLDYNGYDVFGAYVNDQATEPERRGAISVPLALQAVKIAPKVEEIIFFTGSSVFTPVIEEVKRTGVRVIVVSSIDQRAPFASDDLRRQADEFWDMTSLLPVFGKDRGKKA